MGFFYKLELQSKSSLLIKHSRRRDKDKIKNKTLVVFPQSESEGATMCFNDLHLVAIAMHYSHQLDIW